MPDNQLFQPLMIQQPDPRQPSSADAWTANTKLLTDYLDQQQARAQQQGLWTGGQVWEGGHPTGAGVVNAAQQYGNAILMGSTAPGKPAPSLGGVQKLWDGLGISHWMQETPGTVTLSKMVVPEEQRGAGVGSEAMRALADYADRTSKTIGLTPDTAFGASSKSRLTDFYRQFGFVPNKGKSRDLTISESMIRPPISQGEPPHE